jgi:fumarate reductase (CoM/CoB) subunit A
LAYEIGAELTDMEQIQFVPFALTHPSSMCGICISDPGIAGPAGVLKNNKGQIVLDHINTMTRAEVARVMALQLRSNAGTEHGGLLLDLSPNLGLDIGRKLWERRNKLGQLNMIRTAYGERAYRWEEPWDVAPTAHYTIGGIKVNALTQSAVPGLYAVGQAMGGIFGADRLGAVSLAELFVFGEIAGKAAAEQAHETEMPNVLEVMLVAYELSELIGRKGKIPPLVLKRRLQKVMWEKVGIAREKKELQEALVEIVSIGQEANEINISPIKAFNREVVHAIELKHMLQCAIIVIQSALTRQETRGAHLRLDYPERDNENWKCNIVLKQSDGKLDIWREGVKA